MTHLSTNHSSDSFSSFRDNVDRCVSSVDARLEGGRGTLPPSDMGESTPRHARRGLLGGRSSPSGGTFGGLPDGGFFKIG